MLRAVSDGTSELRVRRLRSEDAASAAQLVVQLGYQAGEAEMREQIEAWAADERGAAFGASIADSLVGCAAIHVVPFFERPGSRARLVALVVDARHRQRGVGRVLVEHAREFARRRGAVEMEVTSRRERTDAERFYRSLGFVDVSEASHRYIAEVQDGAGHGPNSTRP